MFCLAEWGNANPLTPDYYNKCNYYGIPNGLEPPSTLPDGQGCIGFLSSEFTGELIQTCLIDKLDTSQFYILSAYAGYNRANAAPSSDPMKLMLFGNSQTCASPSYTEFGCPPLTNFEFLTEIDYIFPTSGEGWVFGQSACFKPTQEHISIVIGASCGIPGNGYNYLDLVELKPCTELLEISFSTR